jgi:hypothetical protein
MTANGDQGGNILKESFGGSWLVARGDVTAMHMHAANASNISFLRFERGLFLFHLQQHYCYCNEKWDAL